MADKTVTVKSADGDYTTLNAAFSGEDGAAFDAFTDVLHIVCYNFEDTTAAAQGTGFGSVSSTHYVSVESYDSHGGVYGTSAYRLKVTRTSHGDTLQIQAGYTRIKGLQIWTNGANWWKNVGLSLTASSPCRAENCIIKGYNSTSAGSYSNGIYSEGANNLIINCLIYDFLQADSTTSGGIQLDSSGAVVSEVLNCTIVNCYIAIIIAGTTNQIVKNTGMSGCTTNIDSAYVTETTNSTSTPTFLDPDNDDFHLASGDTTWKNQGTDLSGTFTDDIDGDTRPTGAGTWDIGADEYVAAAGGSIVPLLLNQYRARRQ